MEKEQLLLAQIRSYLILAKELKSVYYLHRAKLTVRLFNELRKERTGIYTAA